MMKRSLLSLVLITLAAPAVFAIPVVSSADILAPFPEEVQKGRAILDLRLRGEYADQDGLESSNAFTFRTRLGYETANYNGFYGLAEYEYNWVLNAGDFDPYPLPGNQQTMIADPRNSQINRLFVGYREGAHHLRAGRQELNYGAQRYVGAVAWRQNDQTFDALAYRGELADDLVINYAWSWRANRIFGRFAPVETLERFKSNNHFLTIDYTALSIGTVGAYFYYLDLADLPNLSSTTVGLYLDGAYDLDSSSSLIYRLEAAQQFDNSASGARDFSSTYLHGRLGYRTDTYEGGAAVEYLGSDDGADAFQTPLATLHKFNGWADVFGTTPPDGLIDYSLWGNLTLPAETRLIGELHYFTAAENSEFYGKEVNVALQKKLNRNLSITAKAARYEGNGASTFGGALPDRTKFWLQLDFSL